VKKFTPSTFIISLMTENGQLVKALDDDDFNLCMNSLDVDQVMKAGNYIIAVDALWNEST
jgi:hypothetical protein